MFAQITQFTAKLTAKRLFLQVPEILTESLRLIQHFSIGMRIVLDDIGLHADEVYYGQLVEKFQSVQYGLNAVLCEIRYVMQVIGVRIDELVAKDILPPGYLDKATEMRRNNRDFLILRDYIKLLDFLTPLFTTLYRNSLG